MLEAELGDVGVALVRAWRATDDLSLAGAPVDDMLAWLRLATARVSLAKAAAKVLKGKR